MRVPGAATITAAIAAAACLCAPLAARGETIRPGEKNSDWTFGLLGHGVPDVLKAAKADPYAAPVAPACETIPREIAALDEVLGPDADAPVLRVNLRARAEKLMVQGIRQGIGGMIPHRDWIRLATGAGRKDKALNEAAMAGWARRGFLKGLEVNLGCGGTAGRRASATAAVQDGPVPVLQPVSTGDTSDPTAAAAAAHAAFSR